MYCKKLRVTTFEFYARVVCLTKESASYELQEQIWSLVAKPPVHQARAVTLYSVFSVILKREQLAHSTLV